jgi:hypothetical protein
MEIIKRLKLAVAKAKVFPHIEFLEQRTIGEEGTKGEQRNKGGFDSFRLEKTTNISLSSHSLYLAQKMFFFIS